MTRPPCVATKLYGGLGNQLFQYAAGRRLALLHARPLVIDLHWYHAIPDGSTPRSELLSELKIVASFANSEGDPARLGPGQRGPWAGLLKPWRVLKERTPFQFDARLLRAPRARQSVYMDGYWQAYRYFDAVRETLLAEIAPRAPLPPRYAGVAAHIEGSESVMLHVRRGDYVQSNRAAALHGALPLSYYTRALERLRERHAAPVLFVFSDDLPWVRANLVTGAETVYVESDADERAVVHELALMRRCRHQIIANSSLSWWGAWLNPNPAKLVFAPSRWQSGQAVPLHDLVPRDWLVLPVD